jgi:hypothetical protein
MRHIEVLDYLLFHFHLLFLHPLLSTQDLLDQFCLLLVLLNVGAIEVVKGVFVVHPRRGFMFTSNANLAFQGPGGEAA